MGVLESIELLVGEVVLDDMLAKLGDGLDDRAAIFWLDWGDAEYGGGGEGMEAKKTWHQ